MRIGIDIRTLAEDYRTGVGEFTTELLNALFALDTKNEYYLFANGTSITTSSFPAWQRPNVHFVITRYPNKLLNLALLVLRWPKLDTLVARHAGVPTLDIFYSPTLNFSRVTRKVKHLLLVHDLTFALFPNYYTLRQKLWHTLLGPQSQCTAASVVLTPSHNTATDVADLYKISPKKIGVLSPGLSPIFASFASQPAEQRARAISLVRQKYQLPDRLVLFVGTIEPRKNLTALIEGFSQASTALPPGTGLVIAGAPGWKNESVYAAAAASPARDKIKFIGYIPAHEKAALFAAADIFVYPSLYEGFGFPVLEALSLGIPVITSNRSSIPEITANSAYLVNPHRPPEIARGLTVLYEQPQLRAALSRAGLERARCYTWEAAAAAWLSRL